MTEDTAQRPPTGGAADEAVTGSRRPEPAGPRLNLQDLFVPATVVVLMLALTVLTNTFMTTGNLLNVATQMATLAIISFGVTVVMIGGAFDLSVGAQMAVHGCVAAIVMSTTDSILAGVAVALLSGLLFGFVNGALVAGLSINPFIVTLGTLVIGRGIALAITGARPVSGLPEELRGFALDRPLGVPWIVWLMLGCFALATFVLHATPYGLRMFALGGNQEAARLSGLRVKRDRVVSFMISGFFAAVAGIALTARLRSGQPSSGEFLELFAVAAVVLGGSSLYGGRGAVWRTLLGVALITIIANGLNLLNVSAPYQMIAVGVVFIIAASSEVLRQTRIRRRR